MPLQDLDIGPGPWELSCETAFRIFPITHQYNMQILLNWCTTAVNKQSPLNLWPSALIASSDVSQHPGLVQWLALADAKQFAPLVETCLSKLLQHDSNDSILGAMASPHLRNLMDGLRSETKTDIMCKLVGLPLGFQVWNCDSEGESMGVSVGILSLDIAGYANALLWS